MQVHIEGIEKLNANLTRLGPEVMRAADRGLKTAGMHIIADAQENLRREGINATGRLSQSGRVQPVKGNEGGYDVGFMDSEKSYAGAVEYGRRAGKLKYYPKLKQMRRQPPPVDEIEQWTAKKMLPASLAWPIAWAIGKRGTKPHPFFKPAVDKNTPRVLKAIQDAIQQVTNRANV